MRWKNLKISLNSSKKNSSSNNLGWKASFQTKFTKTWQANLLKLVKSLNGPSNSFNKNMQRCSITWTASIREYWLCKMAKKWFIPKQNSLFVSALSVRSTISSHLPKCWVVSVPTPSILTLEFQIIKNETYKLILKNLCGYWFNIRYYSHITWITHT